MTRIRIRIAKTSAPAPRSMTSLIASGFSRSSRRTKSDLPKDGGRLARVTASCLQTSNAPLMPLWYLSGRCDAVGVGRPTQPCSRRILHFACKLLHASDSGTPSLPLSSSIGKALLQIRNQILAFARNMNGLTLARLGANPPGQRFRGRNDVPTFSLDRHARFLPALGYRNWLT